MHDTHPDAERRQVDLLRAAGPIRRAELASNLTNRSRERALEAIRRARPELSELDRLLLFAEVHYGRELGQRIRAYLEERTRER